MYSFMHIIFKTNLCSDNLDRQKKVNLEAVKQFPFFLRMLLPFVFLVVFSPGFIIKA